MKVTTLVPLNRSLDDFLLSPKKNKKPFDAEIVDFLDAFSKILLSTPDMRAFPELISLAFWMRKSQVKKLSDVFTSENEGKFKVPRGLVFHLAPANVDTIFIYSMFLSLMMGNKNVVRVSSKESAQQQVLLQMLNQLLQDPTFLVISDFLQIITYPHDETITKKISQYCDCRVIWGGDLTIQAVSAIPLKPTAVELRFADKYSISIIDTCSLRQINEKAFDQLVDNFINDAYWFGQMACSSPRTVFWLGADNDMQEIFWSKLQVKLQKFEHNLELSDFVNKYVASQEITLEVNAEILETDNSLLTRISLKNLDQHPRERHCGVGLFYEYKIDSIKDIKSILDRKIQTATYFGSDLKQELLDFVIASSTGIDRIVPIGKALDFHYVWDGYDFFNTLTREIQVQ